jgi:beta-N-acetylhexosaminidase
MPERDQSNHFKSFLRISIAVAIFAVGLFLLINWLLSLVKPSPQEIISSLSLRQKVAQMFVFYYPGQSFKEATLTRIQDTSPGGMIVMGDNIQDSKQLIAFTHQFAKAASSEKLGRYNNWLRPLVMVDQEGGLVKRVKWDETVGPLEWASISTEDLCQQSISRAKTLGESGINVNLAPVIDIRTESEAFINNRTISADADKITELANEFIECSQGEGIAATIKHFPGHGATSEDSHFVVPQIEMGKEEWLETHGKVFKDVIAQSSPLLAMSAHLQFTQIDPQPATLSEKMISQVLKDELGFSGVVLTDDMAQLHTAIDISHEEAITRAINAGNDMILYINTGKYTHEQLVDMAVSQVEAGQISEARIDDALTRIIALKLSY